MVGMAAKIFAVLPVEHAFLNCKTRKSTFLVVRAPRHYLGMEKLGTHKGNIRRKYSYVQITRREQT